MSRRIDPTADRAVYRQLADILRAQIESGELAAGEMLPSETRLIDIYDVGRNSVRQALALLRGEGLITMTPRVGAHVRRQVEPTTVHIRPGDRVTARLPTAAERRELGIPEGVPVLVVHRAGGEEIHAGDRTLLQVEPV